MHLFFPMPLCRIHCLDLAAVRPQVVVRKVPLHPEQNPVQGALALVLPFIGL